MKALFFFGFTLAQILTLGSQAFASGCFNDPDLYNIEKIESQTGLTGCYFKELELRPEPKDEPGTSPLTEQARRATRQYNYFASRLNEYVSVFSTDVIANAQFEFMFYRKHLKGALSPEDARDIDFTYDQTFLCNGVPDGNKSVTVRIRATGTVGLTGVCLSKVD